MEPIAIIGIGCRFPGNVNSSEDLWNLLKEGKDVIDDIPSERFGNIESLYDPKPGAPGKIITRQGGYLANIDLFDPSFFDIAPKEAAYIDPQQRLLLEVGWEALEDANVVIEAEQKAHTGVFVGVWTSDYETYMYHTGVPINLYMTTGGSRYAAAGRLSYALDARGPSLTIDTACSSSLVALHLACQSIRAGECSLALVGGANLILQPHITLGYSRSKMLSPESRCKFGDERADGYVRSEGVAVVLLKRLSQALADHNSIYAVIQGSAVNNDGQGSGSLVAPSIDGQIALLREAYRVAGISPGQVHYVEAHGTGTKAGDLAELKALGAVLREGRELQQLCHIGSIKTNLGHTEAASGLAGLIKVALCLKHRAFPPSLHMHTPSARIPWQELPLTIQQTFETIAPNDENLYAAVNSFGITGTNAHVILRNAPVTCVNTPASSQGSGPHAALLPLSAHSTSALRALASRYQELLCSPTNEGPLSWHDICIAASRGRKHMKHRMALLAHSKQEMLTKLHAFLADPTSQNGACGQTISSLQPVFVCGRGHPQWIARGRELLAQEPVFREVFLQCEECFRQHTTGSLLARLAAEQGDSQCFESGLARGMIFALQVASLALWRSWGITSEQIIGQDIGEVAAAYATGEIGLEEALYWAFTAERNTLTPYRTSNMWVAVADRSEHVLATQHSPSFSPILRTVGLTSRYASTAAALIDAPFEEHLSRSKQSALLTEMIQTYIDAGSTLFIEVGPRSDLSKTIRCSLEEHRKVGTVLSWFPTEEDQHTATLRLLRSWYLLGGSIAWKQFYHQTKEWVHLPRYPWQRERFWLEAKLSSED